MMRTTPRCAMVAALLTACSKPPAPPPAPEAPTATLWTDPSPHTAGFITVNGARLTYLDWGGTGPALVLIHGFGDNPHAFDDIAPAFVDKYRVVAYGRRGQGGSEAKGPYDLTTFVEDLRGVMDSLKIAKAHLAGWSMGGNEITAMAGRYPGRVGRIVYLDAGYDWADPAVVNAFNQSPADLSPPPSALASIEGYRNSHVAVWFAQLEDLSRVEGYVRGLVTIQADGSVRPVMTDSAGASAWTSLTTEHRDYRKVKTPALAIYETTFFDTAHPDTAQARKNLTWETSLLVPFRRASIDRIKRELPQVEVITVPGNHADFLFLSKNAVVAAMRRFLE